MSAVEIDGHFYLGFFASTDADREVLVETTAAGAIPGWSI
jgi:hypothetical protein